MSLREAQKRLTRELLLREGLGLFESKGYAATTIDDIAAAAGTTRQTFYLHFASKATLMKELITAVDQLLIAEDDPRLAAVVASGDREQIHAWLGTKIDQWPAIKPYIIAAHEAAAQDAEIREAIDVWFESAISDIHRGLDAAGRFTSSSRRVRGTLAFGQLEFASRRWMRHGWDVDRDETHAVLTESWSALLVD
ncbi:TetR/AcrR family transcriptional regulator [Geodermatophilus sabuli]|uniref:Transcriptional regulator, TetR family n=1 Tax=Geodermatophilus sabuli TaxID=1564158 RepID=A0A285EDU5_9ACTN|nr:TetR/AcrR family transcriptional regulator [Geodermatophilus sabuli]MBB3084357.1 AcrR family transcriptional regulator [Geodermatophilus sabuli]SNX96374.1 transcriptional regulator, TetR family [Geodermatophilus sabuli]